MNKIDLAYLGGLIDGEGYVGIKKAKAYRCQGRVTAAYHARIQVRMVDEGAIAFLAKTLGGWYYKEKPSCNEGRPLYCWQASDKNAEKCLKALFPYMRVKNRQAKLVLKLRELLAGGWKHRTKVTGTRQMPHHCGKIVNVRTFSYSDEFVKECDDLWNQCRLLNGLARFQKEAA